MKDHISSDSVKTKLEAIKRKVSWTESLDTITILFGKHGRQDTCTEFATFAGNM